MRKHSVGKPQETDRVSIALNELVTLSVATKWRNVRNINKTSICMLLFTMVTLAASMRGGR